jgi:aspartokinase/homoserine dehydrogenase 1
MLVIKFGGTSVADAARMRVAARIAGGQGGSTPVVVVVSAMASITDALLRAARLAQAGDAGYLAVLADVAARHHAAYLDLGEAVPARFTALWDELLEDAAGLAPPPIQAERFSGWGERLVVDLFAQALRAEGFLAEGFVEEPVLLQNRDPAELAEPSILATRAALVPRIMPLLFGGGIAVLPGYIARDAAGHVTTLGRNGSDYSAAIITAALGAEALYIYSDVAGIYTADPRLFAEAELLPRLTYAEVRAIAATGAKVVHPRTVEPLASWGIPLHLRSTFAPDAPGTDVLPDAVLVAAERIFPANVTNASLAGFY